MQKTHWIKSYTCYSWWAAQYSWIEAAGLEKLSHQALGNGGKNVGKGT